MEQSGWTAPRVRSGVTEVHPLEHGVIGTQNNPSSGRGKTSPRHSECADPVRTRCFPPRQRARGDPGRLSMPALQCVKGCTTPPGRVWGSSDDEGNSSDGVGGRRTGVCGGGGGAQRRRTFPQVGQTKRCSAPPAPLASASIASASGWDAEAQMLSHTVPRAVSIVWRPAISSRAACTMSGWSAIRAADSTAMGCPRAPSRRV